MIPRTQWADLYAAGKTAKEIGAVGGVSYQIVLRFLRAQGVAIHPKGRRPSTLMRTPWHVEAVLLRREGHTLKAIAKRFGVTHQAVHQATRPLFP